jgi:hypothetical protein
VESYDVLVGDRLVALELQQFMRDNGWARDDVIYLGREGKLYHFKLYDKQKAMLFKLRFCG